MRSIVVSAALALFVAAPAVLRADVEAVNKYLGEATELAEKGSMFYEDANSKLELAEASLDDVPEAQKPTLKAKIEALKSKIAGAADAQEKSVRERDLKQAMKDAEEAIGNLATWSGAASTVKELLDDPKTAALLGADQVANYRKQFATFSKLHSTKALKENLANARQQVEELEKSWAERQKELKDGDASPNSKEAALTDTSRDLEGIDRTFADMPADNADVKSLLARVEKVKSELGTAASGALAGDVMDRINRFLESYSSEFEGMDAETGDQTWTDYKEKRELAIGKTEDFVSRVGDFLKTLSEDDSYKAAKEAPAVKAKVAELAAKVEAGKAKIKKNCEALVAALEKTKVNKDNESDASLLHDQVRNAMGEESEDGKTMLARLDKLTSDFTDAGAAADAEKLAYYKSMTEKADAAWPEMMAKYDVVEDFDPNNYKDFKGKFIKIETDNLMGWRFKPGDFPFATTLNGKPIAGKYDPAVAKALKEIESKLGRSIGDSDEDGRWTVICRVEGNTGTLYQKSETGGDVTVDGSKVGTWSGTKVDPVESPIVTVVAAKAGPLAASTK